MKNILVFLFSLLTISISFAQEENPLPYVMQEPKFDTAPQFKGGSAAMMKYFEDSIRYPEPEKTKHIEGYVSVKFNVTTEGKVINVRLINGVAGGPNLAAEAVRVMRAMPPWIAATKKGIAVESEYFLSIPFIIR